MFTPTLFQKTVKISALVLFVTFMGVIVIGCNESSEQSAKGTHTGSTKNSDDKEQIIQLVKQVYKWHDADSSKNDMVCLTDLADSIYVGVDMEKQKLRSQELRNTGLFSDEFINNYYKIAETIDQNLRNKKYGDEWLVGDLPPFGSGADAWCKCQDYPYDNPWDKINIKFISLDDEKSTLTWTWGDTEWGKGFEYEVRVVKEGGLWKVSYLEGFDYEKFPRKNY